MPVRDSTRPQTHLASSKRSHTPWRSDQAFDVTGGQPAGAQIVEEP
jgi:hypothetical protein